MQKGSPNLTQNASGCPYPKCVTYPKCVIAEICFERAMSESWWVVLPAGDQNLDD